MNIQTTLAFSPSKTFSRRLHLLLQKKFKTSAPLDITVDKKIIGGLKITFNGKFFDYSLSRLIQKSLKNQWKEL